MKKQYLVVFILILFLLSSCSNKTGLKSTEEQNKNQADNKKSKITISHEVSEDMTKHTMFQKFKELVEKNSNGKFDVEIFPNAQLGGDDEAVASTQQGNITISAPSAALLGNFSPALQVFDLPFIFKDSKTAHQTLDGDVGSNLLKKLEDKGLVGLGFSENGWRQLTNSKKSITSPDQLNGLKIRTMNSPIHITAWKQLGANVTPMSFTEVFTSLSQGTIDGQENPLQIIYSMKLYEVNKYVTLTGHIYDPEPIIINKKFFDSLSPQNQKIIQDAAKEVITLERTLNQNSESDIRKKLGEKGAVVADLSPEQRQVWVDKVKPIYKQYANTIGSNDIKAVLKAAGNSTLLDYMNQ
ncbi:TRAP transporter substrate-binding protein [Paenibacillus foliorum]|nr:TRAP transporter substrate-binding protein [Paenibacillus foliorum]